MHYSNMPCAITCNHPAGMSIGHKGMLYAARCMAEGTKLLMETPGAIEKAWEWHNTHE